MSAIKLGALLTPGRMATLEGTESGKRWQGRGETGARAQLVGTLDAASAGKTPHSFLRLILSRHVTQQPRSWV